jgi:hypothetical protein
MEVRDAPGRTKTVKRSELGEVWPARRVVLRRKRPRGGKAKRAGATRREAAAFGKGKKARCTQEKKHARSQTSKGLL